MPQSLRNPQIEARVDDLLGRMTLEEKVGQTNQTMMLGEGHKVEIAQGAIGSSIFASTAWAGKDAPVQAQAEFVNEYQRVAMEKSRLKIPLLMARDVIHGHRTVFPIPLGQAAAWNPALVQQAAAVAAVEGTADGVKWFFTPMLDIARDARWGRIAEGYGEDPCLASRLAAAAVRGYQGDNLADPRKAIACVKHYAGYGLAEGGRDYDRAEVSMRSMRDVYLRPFKAAIDAGAATLMAGFHDFNGVPVAASRQLLTDVLRDEWGFQGLVVSDWNAVLELIQHGVAATGADAAALAIQAGVDMDMVSLAYSDHLARLVRDGRVPVAVLDEAVRRILRVKFMAGLFESPYVDESRAHESLPTPESRVLARQLAQESIVLLKNKNRLLPFDDSVRDIAVFGPLANAQSELFGSWTLDGRAEDVTPIAEAIRALAPHGVRVRESSLYPDQAIYQARGADVAVIVVGEHPSRSGEASSIATLDLPAGQRELITAAHEAGLRIVLIVIAGRPLTISREVAMADAVLYAWQPGVEGGNALANLLFGLAAPSGKLPVTLPRATGQVPIYYSRKNSGRPANPYTDSTGYIDLPFTPLFPFGYGMSYTTFDYADLKVEKPQWHAGEEAAFTAQISNEGGTFGEEIVQLYVRDLVGSVTRPIKELKGFDRVALQPGESKTVRFALRAEDLSFAGLDDRDHIESGEYYVWIGSSSTQGLQGKFELKA